MFKIVRREELAGGSIILNEIEAASIAKKAVPGQFLVIKANEKGERIPLTMADTNTEKGTITIIYMVVGKTTEIFKSLKVGDSYQDIIGPLGSPTHITNTGGTVVCVGGGTGIAVLHPITRGLKKAGNKVITILGARSKDLLIMEKEMCNVSDEVRICTDDGTYGRKGLVTEELKDVLQEIKDVKQVVAIGPVPMMKYCALTTKDFNVETLVSLNPIMIDGTGMCGCCRVTVDGKTKFACVDGPEFDGHKVDFDLLTKRLNSYLKEEQESMEAHKCNMEKEIEAIKVNEKCTTCSEEQLQC